MPRHKPSRPRAGRKKLDRDAREAPSRADNFTVVTADEVTILWGPWRQPAPPPPPWHPGMMPDHWAVLHELAKKYPEPVEHQELATDAGMGRATLGRRLEELRGWGYVARPGKTRRKGNAITAAGLDALKAARANAQ